ncbi:MAG: hypothetical protein ACO3A4_02225 [Silvanigrellaceae bacterium]
MMKTNKPPLVSGVQAKRLALTFAGVVLVGQAGCKSRFFFFGQGPQADTTPSASTPDTRSGQIAIGQQGNENVQGQTTPSQQAAGQLPPYKALQGATEKKVQFGKTIQFEINGRKVDLTFVSILEDSRCPKDVVCIWEGQARLKFNLSIPSANLSKVAEVTLRAGHPEAGQILLDGIGVEIIALNPDTATNTSAAQKLSPEATLLVGKAP